MKKIEKHDKLDELEHCLTALEKQVAELQKESNITFPAEDKPERLADHMSNCDICREEPECDCDCHTSVYTVLGCRACDCYIRYNKPQEKKHEHDEIDPIWPYAKAFVLVYACRCGAKNINDKWYLPESEG